MGFDAGRNDPYHILAGEDLTAAQYKAVKLDAGFAYLAVEGDGDAIWGVLQDNPAIGRSASVMISGFAKVLLGAPCTANQSMGPLVDGTFGPGATTAIVKAAEDGQAGDVITAWVGQAGVVGGQTTANVEYTKITSTDVDETPRTSADWPGGLPPANAKLDVHFLPHERDRVELHIWNGTTFDLISDNLTTVVETAHGLTLTTKEGERVPVAWFYDGTNSRVPAGIEEVNHFAIAAPDANTLTLRVAANMDGRTYSGCTNALGALGETVYWDPATNEHTLTAEALRLFQVSDTDLELIKWDMEDTRSTETSAGVSIVVDEWQAEILSTVLAGSEVLNANFVQLGGGVEVPPLATWATDINLILYAGGNLVARSGTANIDLTGTGTVTGVSFNQDLYIGDRVTIRRMKVS